MNEPAARFEYRLFAPHMGTTELRLRSLASCSEITESREIYLLDCADALEHNVKIRGGRLELKRLVDRDRDLERWQPAGQWAFPVTPDTLHTLWSDPALKEYPFPTAGTSLDELLKIAAEMNTHLHRVNLFKRRFRFSVMDCEAEIDHLLVNGTALESFAVESEDPQAVHAVRSELGLETFENQSYPLMICRTIGLRPLPNENDYG